MPDLHLHVDVLLVLNGVSAIIFGFVFYLQQKNNKYREAMSLLAQASVVEAPVNLTGKDDESLLEHMLNFLCLKDAQGRWLRASPTYLEIFNLQGIDYQGKTDVELASYPQSDREALMLSAINDKTVWHLKKQDKETRKVGQVGKEDKVLEITRTPVFDAQKKPIELIITGHFIGVGEDQTALQERGLGMMDVSDICHFSLLFLDADFKIVNINNAFSKMTGYVFDDIENKPLTFLIEDEFNPVHNKLFKTEDDSFWSGELICRHKEGYFFPIRLDITVLKKDQQAKYFASLVDITRQKQTENRILKIAHYDDLTGLVNRVMFFGRLNRFLAGAKLQKNGVVFLVDLDRFKAVNDSLGHDAGDELLKEVAGRLLSAVRKQDVVSRLGGDEFALLLLNEQSHEEAVYTASMIAEKIIQKIAEPFYIQRSEVFIGASIGIAVYPDDGLAAEELLKHADISMYEAKRQGRNSYQFYKQDYKSASQDRLELEVKLRKALERDELQLYYQPQYYASDRKLSGAEVLIRWRNGPIGESKMISPDQFIPIAEDTGLIVEIGAWILKTACVQMTRWLQEGYPLQQISVNVSARQFSDNNFLKIVEDALVTTGLDAKHLELEITESMLIGDIKKIELQLHRLKKMGLTIVLDDFGTGYSSLSYLKNFPIDVLKIDQSFIKGTALYSKNARIACAIINMGHSLGQKIVAEGVETEHQLMFLTHRGCDIIQGYFFSKPLPVSEMTALLSIEGEGKGPSSKKSNALFAD
ncbi:MAG: EAL domain-containing protein [Methylovulum sp.]|nr:EAL domain-containing protein [Methylovulum sp.]